MNSTKVSLEKSAHKLKYGSASSSSINDESGYSSDSSSASLKSQRLRVFRHSLSDDIFLTPDLPLKGRYSTPYSAKAVTCVRTPSPEPIRTFLLRNRKPVVIPDDAIVVKKANKQLDDNVKCVKVKETEEKCSLKIHSPIKSPFKLCKKYKKGCEKEVGSVGDVTPVSKDISVNKLVIKKLNFEILESSESDSLLSEKSTVYEIATNDSSHRIVDSSLKREAAVRQLFKDSIEYPKRRISPRLSNVLLRLLNEAPYLLPQIFSYLATKDLISAFKVNRCFYQIISTSLPLNRKVKQYFEDIKKDRENIGKENLKCKDTIEGSACFVKSSPRKYLQRIQNNAVPSEKARTFNSATLFEKFVREGKKLLPGEIQQKCVQCQNPARVIQMECKAICTKDSCAFIYCTRCLLPFHQKSSDCIRLKPQPKAIKATKILSKACKNRLRRL